MADKTFGSSEGLTILAEDQATPANGMVAYVTSSWNSGYQVGDIKGAFLSDTDDTDLVGSGELVTNGTFDTDTDWTKAANWTISGGQADAVNTSNGDIYQTITTVVGKTYVLSCDLPSTFTGITAVLQIRNSANTASIEYATLIGVSGSQSLTFVATSTSYLARVYTTAASGSIDNISVKLADEDRSVNNNGLTVNGTVTRTPVDEV